MDVQVVEFAAVNGFEDNIGRGMRREAKEPDSPRFLKLASGGDASAFAKRVFQKLPVVDAVQAEQVNVVQPQVLHRSIESAEKFLGCLFGTDFGLDDDFI